MSILSFFIFTYRLYFMLKTKFKRAPFFLLIPFIWLTLACSSDDEPELSPLDLKSFLDSNDAITSQLIACAAGGDSEILASTSLPVSIIFYPEERATDFRYFETDGLISDKRDLSLYHQIDLNDVPLFGGFLRYFEQEAIEEERWGIVTYLRDGVVHYSEPIRLKYSEKPTEFNNSLLDFDQSEKLSPRFAWEDGRINENVIYFHAITDANDNLISGTYTTDKKWQFYDLSNVVLNVRDVTPAPMLIPDGNYQYTMLAVSIDNWVNLVIKKEFDTF